MNSNGKLILLILLLLVSFIISLVILINDTTRIKEELSITKQKLEEVNRRLRDTQSQLQKARESRTLKAQPSRGNSSFIATAYTWTGQKTKTGTWPKVNRTVAVDPKVIPLGSKLKIVSDYPGISGTYIAEDTGGLIRGSRIDIFVEESIANDFGRRPVKLKVAN